MLQRSRVGGIAIGRLLIRVRQCGGRRFHGLCRLGTSGPARDIGRDSLSRNPFVLLGQPSDERVGDADRTVHRFEVPGEDPQQGALARAVGADDADHIAGCHRHVKTLEECAMGEPAGHVLRDEGCGHGSMFSPPLSYGADEAVASDP